MLNILAITCPDVQLPNGQVITSNSLVNGRYPISATISFSCDLGYTLNTTGSNPSITCLDTGDWSHPTPRCNVGNGFLLQLCNGSFRVVNDTFVDVI